MQTREDLEEAEAIYHGLNDELRHELPRLYDSRINFLASNFAALFNVEMKFQEESNKVDVIVNTITFHNRMILFRVEASQEACLGADDVIYKLVTII